MVRTKNKVIYLHNGFIYNNSFQKKDIDADGVYRCYFYTKNDEEAEFLKSECEKVALEKWGELPPEYTSPIQPAHEWYSGVGKYWLQATSIYPPSLHGIESLEECWDAYNMDIAIKPVAFEGKYKKGIVLNLVSVSKNTEL